MEYLGLLIAGMLLCNAIPHLVSGLRGERFYTPWARPRGIGKSSPVQNMAWGSANLLLAAVLIDRIFPKNLPHGLVLIAIGFVGAGLGLSYLFGKRQEG